MNDTRLSDSIFGHLTVLHSYSENVELCMDTRNERLYVSRSAPTETWGLYKTMSMISDPYLVRIAGMKADGAAMQVLTDYVPGVSLTCYLRDRGTQEPEEAFRMITEICAGLQALHEKGIVHRDINPNNIIVMPDGHIKIIDFGIARSFLTNKQKDTMILGTPGYAAPEQFGFGQSDAHTDIYAVGVLLNVMLTGKMPNEKTADGKAGEIVRRCTALEPADRYATVFDVRDAITGESNKKPGRKKDRKKRMNFFDWLLSQIPGLRSKNKAVVIASGFGYLTFLSYTGIIFLMAREEPEKLPFYAVAWALWFPVPHFCFHNVLGFRNWFPGIRHASERTKQILFITVGILSILTGLFIFGYINMEITDVSGMDIV